MAHGLVRAQTAFEPGGILADPARRTGGVDDASSACNQALASLRISFDPFGMEGICILHNAR